MGGEGMAEGVLGISGRGRRTPSRHVSEHVLIAQVALGGRVGHEPGPCLLEAKYGQLSPQSITDHVTPRPAQLPTEPIQLALELRIQADSCSILHV